MSCDPLRRTFKLTFASCTCHLKVPRTSLFEDTIAPMCCCYILLAGCRCALLFMIEYL